MLKYVLFYICSLTFTLYGQHKPTLWGTGYGGEGKAGQIFKYDLDSNKQNNLYDFPTTYQSQNVFAEHPGKDSLGRLFGYAYNQNSQGKSQWELYQIDTINGIQTKFVFDSSLNNLCGPLVYFKGYFYGTARSTGNAAYGAIFQYNPYTNKIKTKRYINNNGSNAYSRLIESNNHLYYIQANGGVPTNCCKGLIAEYDAQSNLLTEVFNFGSISKSGIFNPSMNVVIKDSILYGTTYYGASNNKGVIYQVNLKSKVFTKLFNMDTSLLVSTDNIGNFNCVDDNIYFTLNQTSLSSLYGGIGMLNIKTQKLSVIYRFNQLNLRFPSTDLLRKDSFFYCYFNQITNANAFRSAIYKFYPASSRMELSFSDSNRRLYLRNKLVLVENEVLGVCEAIGNYPGSLVVFELTSSKENLSVFYELIQSPNGSKPEGHLFVIKNKIYGVCTAGGKYNAGTLYSYDVVGKKLNLIHTFGTGQIGNQPNSNLVVKDGVIYGTTSTGGANNYGTIFSYDTISGKLKIVYSFTYNSPFYSKVNLLSKAGSQLIIKCNETVYKYDFKKDTLLNFYGMTYNFMSNGADFYYLDNFYSGFGRLVHENSKGFKEKIDFRYPSNYYVASNFVRVNNKLYAFLEKYYDDSVALFEYNIFTKSIKIGKSFTDSLLRSDLLNLVSINGKIYATTMDGMDSYPDWPFDYYRFIVEIDPSQKWPRKLNALIVDRESYNLNKTSTLFATADNNLPTGAFNKTQITTCNNNDTVLISLTDLDGDSLFAEIFSQSADSLNIRKLSNWDYQILFDNKGNDSIPISVTFMDGYGDPVTINAEITNPRINPVLTVNKNKICPGDSAQIKVSNNAKVIWNDGDTSHTRMVRPKVSQLFSVVAIKDNCQGKDSLETFITVFPTSKVTLDCLIDTVCNNHDLFQMGQNSKVTPSNGFYYGDDISLGYFIPYNTHPSIKRPSFSHVYYKFTDANKCSNIAMDSIYVDTCDVLKLDRLSAANNLIHLYPNPVHGNLNVSSSSPIRSIELLMMDGKSLKFMDGIFKLDFELNLDGYTKGVYMLRIINAEQVISVHKISVE